MMHRLRTAHIFTKLVLVWFALSIGVALASPIVKPQSLQLLCSGMGVAKLLVQQGDGSEALPNHDLDCALCIQAIAPPPAAAAIAAPLHPLTYAARTTLASPVAVRTAAPPPGRGPPSP